MRLIDADALSERLCKTTIFVKDGEVFQRMINDAPTVSAEARPTGEWIDIDNYYRMATCSHCLKVTMFEKWGEYTRPYNFCPNCGARMLGEDGEE